jgi:hypothetical protein
MRFTSDRQRRACFANINRFAKCSHSVECDHFANINKFAVRSETGENLRPIFDQRGVRASLAGEYEPSPTDIVVGYTGSAIRVDRRNKYERPRVDYDLTQSQKEEGMKIYNETGVLPENVDIGFNKDYPENTIILAGEDYKRYEGGRDPGLRKYRAIILAGDKALGIDKYNKDMVSGLSELERKRGSPVYSEKSDRELSRDVYKDVKRLKDVDDASGMEDVPHLFEDKHHLENLEIDSALKSNEAILGRHRNMPKITKSYAEKVPYLYKSDKR